MSNILKLVVLAAIIAAIYYLYTKYKAVAPTKKAGYVDVDGTIDYNRDTAGNMVTNIVADDSAFLHPLSYKQSVTFVDNLKFPITS